jgi:REP element-mobilizing transposase RayT
MALDICISSPQAAISAVLCWGKNRNRDLFLEVLEQVRRRYRFVVVGYVVMPEHVHLLLGEPERRNPSVVMQALKQGFARRVLRKMRKRDSRQGSLWDAALEEEAVFAIMSTRNVVPFW